MLCNRPGAMEEDNEHDFGDQSTEFEEVWATPEVDEVVHDDEVMGLL